MAFLQVAHKSEILKMEQAFSVILPQIGLKDTEKKKEIEEHGFKTLFLLHGLSDDHSIWMRRTSIERYALEYGIAVVMPSVNRSFYADMKQGLPYYSYMAEELPHVVRSYFPLSKRREDNYIAGLSMGGYGAFMIALRNPGMFAAAGSFSGVVDIAPVYTHTSDAHEDIRYLLKQVFGSRQDYVNSDYNTIAMMEKHRKAGVELPRLYQCCGTEDFLYPVNTIFRRAAKKLGVALTYEEGPGAHEWGYWDASVQRFLEWLFN